jgi:hypothetical protein
MKEDIFDQLEKEISIIINNEPNRLFSLHELHSNLFSKRNLKDPIEKEDFKKKVTILFNIIQARFDFVKIIKKNGVLYVSNIENDENDENDEKFSDEKKNVSYEKSFEEELKEEKNSYDFPSEYESIQYMIDNNIKKYYSKKYNDGNTILHKLVMYGDFGRFKKIYKNNDLCINELNDNGKTPIELNSDIRFSNLLITDLLEIDKYRQHDIINLKNVMIYQHKEFNKELNKLYYYIRYLLLLVVLSISPLILLYFYLLK